MVDILQDFPIKTEQKLVFNAISTPQGLNTWWTKDCSGNPAIGSVYELGFGAQYQWRATVIKLVTNLEFELEMIQSDQDWDGTKVGFILESVNDLTLVRFHHSGWKLPNEHFRISTHCWAMYLRILRRSLEYGESVEYENRLDA